MGATDITEAQRQPSEERKTTNQGKAVVIPLLRFRSLCCGSWLFPSLRVPEQPRAKPLRFPCCDFFPFVAASGSFPLRVPEAARQRQPSEERQHFRNCDYVLIRRHTKGKGYERHQRNAPQRRADRGRRAIYHPQKGIAIAFLPLRGPCSFASEKGRFWPLGYITDLLLICWQKYTYKATTISCKLIPPCCNFATFKRYKRGFHALGLGTHRPFGRALLSFGIWAMIPPRSFVAVSFRF